MTIGISPKVALPALALLAAGVVLAVVGAIVGNDTLVTVGLALVAAAGGGGAIGYAAPAGAVETTTGPSSDELLKRRLHPGVAKDRLGI